MLHSPDFMKALQGDVHVHFRYAVHFTTDLFSPGNPLFAEVLGADKPVRVLFVIDAEVEKRQQVAASIREYVVAHGSTLQLAGEPIILPGGEQIKNEPKYVELLHQAVHERGLDRHSYLAAIGGGALLDLAGFAAATAHRGIRHVRIPTTTLSQNDSGVGVKNGVNAFGKKNFVGTFAPAWAVFNDVRFLESLPDREWRNGIAEAIKVALIKDADFFQSLEEDAPALAARDLDAMGRLIFRCADLHVRHICQGGDPFEMGSSRPLDFGHWSAHKLEQLTDYKIHHGEAVAIGLALDVTYSQKKGWIREDDQRRVLDLLEAVGFELYAPELGRPEIFDGLREFQEHLGGELTIQMLKALGDGFNVHEVDEAVMRESVAELKERSTTAAVTSTPAFAGAYGS